MAGARFVPALLLVSTQSFLGFSGAYSGGVLSPLEPDIRAFIRQCLGAQATEVQVGAASETR